MNRTKVHIVVTASLIFENYITRKDEYINSISHLIDETQKLSNKTNIDTYIYIVENGGHRITFLQDFEKYISKNLFIKVYYTNHNSILTHNKGLKELLDLTYFLKHFEPDSISDDDILVKITGRYRVGKDCTFLNVLYHHLNDYDAFIRTGAFMYPSQTIDERDNYDCLTGLFGARAGTLRQELPYYIKNLREHEWIEWVIIMIIQNSFLNKRIHVFDYLGLWIKTAYMKEYQLF